MASRSTGSGGVAERERRFVKFFPSGAGVQRGAQRNNRLTAFGTERPVAAPARIRQPLE